MGFDNFLSGGFTTTAVINPPESKRAKRTSVEWTKKTELLQFYSRVEISIENFVLWSKMSKYVPGGKNEEGRVVTPTSFSIFISHEMKCL